MAYSCKKDKNEGGDDGTYPNTFAEQSRSEKKGVGFAFQVVEDVDALGSAISWSYNWGISQSETYDASFAEYNLDYFPMAWNGVNETTLRNYIANHPKCKYILAFNEPNLTDQANMTPSQAAEKWPQLKAIAKELGLKIISPAMNNGTLAGYADPIKWLDEFFNLVPISDVDGIAIHCYMPAAAATKAFIERFKKYDKPIWLTEFCAWDGNQVTRASQMKYMSDIINYMEAEPAVERYAWFIPRRNGKTENDYPYMHLLTKTPPIQLTALGKIFVNMSTQDKKAWNIVGQIIEAEHYSSICVVESVGVEGFVEGPYMRPTTDEEGILELCNFYPEQWVEYQVQVPQTKTYTLTSRYACYHASEADVLVDGKPAAFLSYPKTGEDNIWDTNITALPLSKGKHTLRLKVTKGALNLNWLSIK
ncbi:hypothetical protein FACS189434_10460 [Bacteroidia bacterium]|nr:hypothetical protein FACS189434_10460 [Bacteroidia bacterium]